MPPDKKLDEEREVPEFVFSNFFTQCTCELNDVGIESCC